ncbi:hypothetical protein [Flavobacterium sp.]|uniref:hypothetical protein n=1 Tax=Flavobacterium sp. TaxID=239 RepID=UPI0040341650
MIRDIENLYVAQTDNKVLVYSTNLKDFVISLNSVAKNLKPYMFYYRLFKKIDYLEHVAADGRKFYLQKVI